MVAQGRPGNGFCRKKFDLGVVGKGPKNLRLLFLAAPAGKVWATGHIGKL